MVNLAKSRDVSAPLKSSRAVTRPLGTFNTKPEAKAAERRISALQNTDDAQDAIKPCSMCATPWILHAFKQSQSRARRDHCRGSTSGAVSGTTRTFICRRPVATPAASSWPFCAFLEAYSIEIVGDRRPCLRHAERLIRRRSDYSLVSGRRSIPPAATVLAFRSARRFAATADRPGALRSRFAC